jgi:hypothetical protein
MRRPSSATGRRLGEDPPTTTLAHHRSRSSAHRSVSSRGCQSGVSRDDQTRLRYFERSIRRYTVLGPRQRAAAFGSVSHLPKSHAVCDGGRSYIRLAVVGRRFTRSSACYCCHLSRGVPIKLSRFRFLPRKYSIKKSLSSSVIAGTGVEPTLTLFTTLLTLLGTIDLRAIRTLG